MAAVCPRVTSPDGTKVVSLVPETRPHQAAQSMAIRCTDVRVSPKPVAGTSSPGQAAELAATEAVGVATAGRSVATSRSASVARSVRRSRTAQPVVGGTALAERSFVRTALTVEHRGRR